MRLIRSFFWVFLGLWLVGASAARASIREASDPIFNSRAQTLLEAVQRGGTDLPLSLQTGRDVYLFITVGAAYTEVRALALPTVPPQRLAQALASATVGTVLAGRTVTWSADDYSAALVTAGHGHLLSRSSRNTVPVGAIVSGLRRAGFMPRTLLRVPLHASGSPLPPPRHRARAFNWYDQRQVAAMGSITVRASLSATDIALVCFFLFFVGAAGVLGLAAANWSARNEGLPVEARRQRYRALAQYPVFAAIALHMPFMLVYLRTPHPLAVSDLWFGSSSLLALSPFLAVGPVAMALILPISRRSETRLFGALPTALSIPMPPEEKAVRQRMARWAAVPHLLAVAGVATGLFLLPRKSPLYPVLHPLSQVLPLLGAVIVSRIFRKPLAAFTRISPDDDLTWRARQLGTQMGVRPHEVRVEDSSKAAHVAAITLESGHHILVSRKLLEIMTPAELEFLLAHHVALMKVKARLTHWNMISLLPGLIPLAVLIWLVTGHSALAVFNLMPFILPLMLLPLFAVILQARRGNTGEARRALAADKLALAVTGDSVAARSALTKLMQNSPVPTGQGSVLPVGLSERMKALAALAPEAPHAEAR